MTALFPTPGRHAWRHSFMGTNAFIGRTEPPAEAELSSALGTAKDVWDTLLERLREAGTIDRTEWKSYSPKHGWALRVLRKKRTIVWLSPCDDGVNVTFILGEKAITGIREARLPAAVVTALDAAPKYPEGTGLRLVARSVKDLPAMLKIAAIKAAN